MPAQNVVWCLMRRINLIPKVGNLFVDDHSTIRKNIPHLIVFITFFGRHQAIVSIPFSILRMARDSNATDASECRSVWVGSHVKLPR